MGKAIVLLSGGIDSSTTLAIAKECGVEVYALSFSYGQRHRKELDSAKRIAAAVGVREHKVLNLDVRGILSSALTGVSAVPGGRSAGGSVPSTYVPARNTIFLSFGAAWAEVTGAKELYFGATSIDYSGYPDCRPEYVEAFQKLLGVAIVRRVELRAPLLYMSKAEIIQRGLELGVDFSHTWSCYNPGKNGKPCGRCDSCRIRRKGFEEAGVADPLTCDKDG